VYVANHVVTGGLEGNQGVGKYVTGHRLSDVLNQAAPIRVNARAAALRVTEAQLRHLLAPGVDTPLAPHRVIRHRAPTGQPQAAGVTFCRGADNRPRSPAPPERPVNRAPQGGDVLVGVTPLSDKLLQVVVVAVSAHRAQAVHPA